MGKVVSSSSEQPEEHSILQRGGDPAQRVQPRVVRFSKVLLYDYENYCVVIVLSILNRGLSQARCAWYELLKRDHSELQHMVSLKSQAEVPIF